MGVFGEAWKNHTQRVKDAWDTSISSQDLVLIPGDISWAMKLPDAIPDLTWIHDRPGTKVVIKGNHDLWWDSLSKVKKVLPPSLHVIQNDIFSWNNMAFIGGARLWDTEEFSFEDWIHFVSRPHASSLTDMKPNITQADKDIFRRELLRLEESLKKLPPETPPGAIKIAMTHYPPIGPKLMPTQASSLFAQYGVKKVVFGHLHSLYESLQKDQVFGTKDGIEYTLVSCDWISCTPKLIHSFS